MSASPSLPPALAAFLRGIEPRARVLARAQAGPALDDAALLAAVREDFSARAARLPLAEWPVRYWGLLLARDELSRPLGATPAHPLYRLAHTRRLALLLRLVVGLEPQGAARVLGLSETAYRALWSDAEDKLAEFGVSPAVLMRWQDAFQAEVRADAAAAPVPPDPTQAAAGRRPADSGAGPRRPRRLRSLSPLQWGLVAVAAVLLAVLAATFIWPPAAFAPRAAVADAAPADLDEPLFAAPARDFDADLVVDPDFALLATPAAEPWDEGVAFLSWWAVEQGLPLPLPAPAQAPIAAVEWGALPVATRVLLAPVESAWPALDGASRHALQVQAEAWAGLDLAGRQALRTAYAGWLAQPALARSARRAAFAEWQALDPGEREVLRQAAVVLAALPIEQQQAQRATFAALEPEVQRDWAQGPRLGRQLPGLRPLLVHLPAGQQAELIAALDALDAKVRDALAARLSTMGTAERAALRGRVLAVAPEQRPALLAAAVSP